MRRPTWRRLMATLMTMALALGGSATFVLASTSTEKNPGHEVSKPGKGCKAKKTKKAKRKCRRKKGGGQNGGGGGQNGTPLEPTDYIAQADSLSQPMYPQLVTEATEFTTFDGERIYLEITRPDPEVYGELPLPTILEASPYHGTIATRIGDRIFPDPKNAQDENAGLTGYFAPRGYSVVMMDLRGTGRSSGCLDHLGPNDARDMKLVIEWAASQPWSNGRVGMTGHSYVGSTPIVAAAQEPKGLVTIAPSAGLASMYDHQFQMGVPYFFQWIGPMIAYEGLAAVRDLPPGFSEPILTGAPTGDNWDYTDGPNPQTGCGMQNSSLTAGSGQVTGQYELWHAKRDWRDAASAVDIPVFMIHGANDNAARIPAAEWFFGERYGEEGDKVWLGQWDHGSTNGRCGNTENERVSHPTCRFDQWKYALHAWFDKHLKQLDVDTGPAVEVFLNGDTPIDIAAPTDPATWGTKVLADDEWTEYPRLQLFPDASDMSLGFAAPEAADSATYSGIDATTPLAAASKVHQGANLVFTSAPLDQDAVFVGLPRLNLEAAVNNQVVHMTTTLTRVTADGQREPMNFCAIQPLLRHGVATPDPVIPGQAMDLPMQCFTMAHQVQAGDHLELEVSTTSRHHASEGGDALITVFTGPGSTTYGLPAVPNPVLHDDVPLRASA